MEPRTTGPGNRQKKGQEDNREKSQEKHKRLTMEGTGDFGGQAKEKGKKRKKPMARNKEKGLTGMGREGRKKHKLPKNGRS